MFKTSECCKALYCEETIDEMIKKDPSLKKIPVDIDIGFVPKVCCHEEPKNIISWCERIMINNEVYFIDDNDKPTLDEDKRRIFYGTPDEFELEYQTSKYVLVRY